MNFYLIYKYTDFRYLYIAISSFRSFTIKLEMC